MSSSTTYKLHHSGSFHDFLAHNLRIGTNLRVYHISTPPTSASPIFAPPPGKEDEPTTCESHFLGVSQKTVIPCEDPQQQSTDTSISQRQENVLVLGIEVLVFSTSSLTTIFVSKADSTGFLPRPQVSGQGSFSIVRAVVSTFLDWLVSRKLSTTISEANGDTKPSQIPPISESNATTHNENKPLVAGPYAFQPERKKIVLSLFARSQNQYLFPGSIENETKHVLDDRQLIKWWCQVLDALVQKEWSSLVQSSDFQARRGSTVSLDVDKASLKISPQHPASFVIKSNAFVIVPGCDRLETSRSFFPSSSRYDVADDGPKWRNTFPADFLTGYDISKRDTAIPVRCMIPRLPDDPKARYCDDLDGTGSDDKGQWRVIQSLEQFWETMEFRQECSAGRLVGFIWVTFDVSFSSESSETEGEKQISSPKTSNGYIESTDVHLPPTPVRSTPINSPKSLLLTSEQYIELSDFLINDTDFAGLSTAVKSTSEWIAKAQELSGAATFGVEVEGKFVPTDVSQQIKPIDNNRNPPQGDSNTKLDKPQTPQVNVLTAFRRKNKRKAENLEAEGNAAKVRSNGTSIQLDLNDDKPNVLPSNDVGPVRTLAEAFVRKKPKVQSSEE